jgi:hypothetical protein
MHPDNSIATATKPQETRSSASAVLQSASEARRESISPSKRLRRLFVIAAVIVMTVGWYVVQVHGQIAIRNQGYIPFSDAPINYRSEELSDPVAKLQTQLNEGKVTLKYESEHGYLKSVLQLLKVPIDSQTLVF